MLKVEMMSLGSIKEFEDNPRLHSEIQIQRISQSIKEFGFVNPILIDEKETIIAGHGRLEAAKKIELESVPVIRLKNLTEAQKRAYVIADNQIALNATWDSDLLKKNLEELQIEEFDLSLLGWGDDLPDFAEVPDYSILDETDLEEQLNEMSSGVRKAIQIEFEAEHYEEAQELVKFWRNQNAYVGFMFIEKLKAEKEKL